MADKFVEFDVVYSEELGEQIKLKGFLFDFFVTDNGSLGFTVHREDDPDHFVDIFVDRTLHVNYV